MIQDDCNCVLPEHHCPVCCPDLYKTHEELMAESEQLYPTDTVDLVLRDYRCSKCWGHLQAHHAADRMTRVSCPRCGDGQGLVSANYVEIQKANDRVNAAEAAYNLREFLPSEHKGKGAKELLEELGFG